VSRIYLVRHGQAGTRADYDTISDVGLEQSRLLGEHFAKQRVRFVKAISGSLARQRQTAEAVAAVCPDFPPIEIDPEWNEFDLDHVYRELGPVLCEEDDEFREHFEARRIDREADRRWTPADLRIVEAWIRGHYRYNGETWMDFRRRIAARRAALAAAAPDDSNDDRNVIIFTSATPIGIWAALSMDVEDHRAMRLAGVLYNASYSVMRLRGDQLRLHSFNAVPHLEPALLTYR
jgi:broad specificity phosphatase PhoE